MELSKIGAGLLLLIAANVALGSVNAMLDKTFDWTLFRRGILKGAVVAAAVLAVYVAGSMNPTLLAVDLGSGQVNLRDAVNLVILAAYVSYGADVIGKLKNALLGGKTDEIQPK